MNGLFTRTFPSVFVQIYVCNFEKVLEVVYKYFSFMSFAVFNAILTFICQTKKFSLIYLSPAVTSFLYLNSICIRLVSRRNFTVASTFLDKT